jgi:hypothetical protein
MLVSWSVRNILRSQKTREDAGQHWRSSGGSWWLGGSTDALRHCAPQPCAEPIASARRQCGEGQPTDDAVDVNRYCTVEGVRLVSCARN